MPANSAASATEPAGTRVRGVPRRGTFQGRPERYAKPGAKPQKATRSSVPVSTSTTSSSLDPASSATNGRSTPSKRTSTVRGGSGGTDAGSKAQPDSSAASAAGS